MEHNELTFAFVVITWAATLIGAILARYRPPVLRPLAAYAVLPDMAADAVESDHRIHFSFGSSAVGHASTISALAAAEVFYRMAERLAISPRWPLVTVSNALTLPLAQDTLRRAYEYRQRMEYYHTYSAVWIPQGPRSLSFAAGAASLSADADAVSNVLLGRFGLELALLGESSLRHDQTLVAHSDVVQGQAIAYAQADHILLGEELYAGAAYVRGRAIDLGGVIALDLLRWLVILGILIAALEAV